jgi:isocitrate dehydrogenase kinase/phosphatase
MTDCNFRQIPPAADFQDEINDEPWYSIHEHDVFPETFGSFFFPNPEARKTFLRWHADLVTAGYWQKTQQTIIEGGQADVFPYPEKRRFVNRF